MELHSFFYYLSKVTALTALFYIIYRIFYEGYGNFIWNRFYLLGSSILSIIIPLINMGDIGVVSNSSGLKMHTFGYVSGIQPLYSEGNILDKITLETALFTILFTGMFVSLVRFVIRLSAVIGIRRRYSAVKEDVYSVHRTDMGMPTFSFFRHIFLNRDFNELDSRGQQQVIIHEKVHADRYHSIDIILMEAVAVFLWFNPFVRLLKKAVQNIHEFEADSEVIRKTDRENYIKLIVDLVLSKSRTKSVVNSFGTPQIKKRLRMITGFKSRAFKIRALIAVPLLLVSLYTFGDFTRVKSIQAQNIHRALSIFQKDSSDRSNYIKGVEALAEVIKANIFKTELSLVKKKKLTALFTFNKKENVYTDYPYRISLMSRMMDLESPKEGTDVSREFRILLTKAGRLFDRNNKTNGVYYILKALSLTVEKER